MRLPQTPQRQVHQERAGLIFQAQKPTSRWGKYTPSDRTTSRTKQWRYAEETSPRCTVVAGRIDLYTGGEGVFREDPDEEANFHK